MTYKDRIVRAMARLAPGEPVALPNMPEPDAGFNDCCMNVAKKISRDGGYAQFGWIFETRPHIPFLAASPHVAWCCPSGKLIDVTPYRKLRESDLPPHLLLPLVDEQGRVCFLLDDAAEGRAERWLPLCKNKNVVAFCRKKNREAWELLRNPDEYNDMIDAYDDELAPYLSD